MYVHYIVYMYMYIHIHLYITYNYMTCNSTLLHLFPFIGRTGARPGHSVVTILVSRRFELILRFLHLADSDALPQRGEPGFDKLLKLRPLFNLLLPRFRDSYTPNQYLSIDESMISFKGRLSFLQYLPKKPHKWGMKAWVLADVQTGYTRVG